jgi:hypothetical protein
MENKCPMRIRYFIGCVSGVLSVGVQIVCGRLRKKRGIGILKVVETILKEG